MGIWKGPGSVRKASRQSAFTLIEVTFAILILASSLVIILGLQSSSIQRTIRDRNKQQAMLVAREILAAIETSREPLEVGERHMRAVDLLKELLPTGSDDTASPETTSELRADLRVAFWELPNIDPQAVKRIDLVISWSDDPLDRLDVTYFVPYSEVPDEELD